MLVVLVDDDPDDLEMFCEAVLSVDDKIECVCFNNAKDLLAYLPNSEPIPDFIFIDLLMPTVSGLECIKEIRAMETFKNCRLIAYSNLIPPNREAEINSLNAVMLTKPSSFRILVAEVRKIIEPQN